MSLGKLLERTWDAGMPRQGKCPAPPQVASADAYAPPKISNAILFRQPSLMPSSSYVEACIDVLSTTTPEPASDSLLCSLIRLQVILDDVSNTLNRRDTGPIGDFDSPAIQYQLQAFKERLGRWNASASNSIDGRQYFRTPPCFICGKR